MRRLLAVKNCLSGSSNFVIAAILISGFGLRVVALNVGLPDTPDPREIIIAQDVLNLIHFTAPPQTYNWPGTAWFYIIAATGKLLSIGGLHLTETRVILLARCINTLLSTATLWLTYSIGKHADNRRVGQIAAGLLAVSMLHATNESRFALVDIPATFCVTLFLYLVARARFSSKSFKAWTAMWLGITLGIGFAVKFTTVFVCLSLIIFIGSDHFYRRIVTVIGVSALTFTLLCPYWLIDLLSPTWNLFFEDFWYEATHYHRGHFGLISTAEAGWFQRFTYLWVLLKWGMGLPLALLVAFGVLRAIISLKGKTGGIPILEALLLAFVIPYLLFIGIHKVKFTRHLLILYPALMLLAALTLARVPSAIGDFFKFARGGSPHIVEDEPRRYDLFGRWGCGIVIGVVVLYSFVYTAAFSAVMLAQPTRIAVSEWIFAHVPPEESISSAPVILFDWLLPELDLETQDEDAEWVLILVPDLEVFQKYQNNPQQYQDEDWYPLSEIELEKTLAFYDRIMRHESPYQLHKTFRRKPQFLGIQISDTGAPFPMRALAHPEILLYHYRN
ncbi:MAG: glycosyltransferase family 39 protein [Candidatus Poribacteria bacterium]|nr:glycosyltransferase family 39 protein [Candidatus Poribacteria bacterium]